MQFISCTIATFLLTSVAASLSVEEWTNLVVSVKGEDDRLFRPDASDHTLERQKEGDCDMLVDAAHLLSSEVPDGEEGLQLFELAAEYATLCTIDNPSNRALFAEADPNIHQAVVSLVESNDGWLSTMACNLIFSASFGSEKNHQSFVEHGAVHALGNVIMEPESAAVRKMYAAAALQNLAASYCETADSTCKWDWTADSADVELTPDSHMISNGSAARHQILEIEGLVDVLHELACHDPIRPEEGENEEDVIMPGSTAVEGEHDQYPAIVTWAAIATLKNLALEPSAKAILEEKGVLECACVARDSLDWLESSKADDLLHFMRRTVNPCWELEEDQSKVCVDGNYYDEGNHTCDDYVDVPDEVCVNNMDRFSGVTPSELCCDCGGGTTYLGELEEPMEFSDEEWVDADGEFEF